jgi:hypothetical protein
MDRADRLGPKYPQMIQVLGVLLDDVKRWYPDLSAELFLRKFISKLEEALRPEERGSLHGILNHSLDIWMGETPHEVLNLLYPKRFGESGYDENVCPFIGCYQLKPGANPIKHMQHHIKKVAESVQSMCIPLFTPFSLTYAAAEVVHEQTAKK